MTADALAERGQDDDNDDVDGTGHTWASTARARGPSKEQEGVHVVGTAGQHVKQRAHEDGTRTKQNKTLMFTAGRLDTIYLSG